MKYPKLVPNSICKTTATLIIDSEEISEDGEPIKAFEFTGKCNYQDKSFTKLTAQKQLITLSGCALFNGDIAPNLANITGGDIIINGEKRNIYQGEKCRNPDGTVNYTRIEVT